MTPVTIDLETYWSATHSLSKMSPITYCTHPETEVISLAYKFGEDKTRVIFGEEKIKAWVEQVDWSDKMVIGHNLSGFDAMILAWRFGIQPMLWACTLAMSRPWHMKDVGGSLAKLVEHYGLGVKDQSALIQTKGRHLCDFTPEEVAAMGVYNKTDVEQCWKLFKIFFKKTPKSELKLIDATVRMLVDPQFVVDRALLEATLREERANKQKMLLDLAHMIDAYEPGMSNEEVAEVVAKTLGSAPKFSQLLTRLGVEVPTKTSPTTGKEAPALAKTDEAFLALQGHPNPVVSAAAQARLGVKSTLLETRIAAFLQASAACGGRLPVPLKYYGGHTGRWSGEQYNCQNLPRVSGKPADALRNSLTAGPGKKIVVADLSGIELRVNHFLWQVPSSMTLYNADPEKADLYKDFASRLYGVDVSEVSKPQRQIGKIAHLGLGFSAGAATFVKIAKIMGGVDMELEQAKEIVGAWRGSYKEIVSGWKRCETALRYAAAGSAFTVDPWGLCTTTHNGIETPKGLLYYPNLRRITTEDDRQAWVCGDGRNLTFLSGGKVDENLVQHLARHVISDALLEMKRLTGRLPALSVHDELVYVVDEAEAEDTLTALQSIMRTPPPWWPELITWSEGDIADTYGAAK